MKKSHWDQHSLNEGIDLELKPLKALRQQIKSFQKQQKEDLINQYKNKGKNADDLAKEK